jgi:hypothetical protein
VVVDDSHPRAAFADGTSRPFERVGVGEKVNPVATRLPPPARRRTPMRRDMARSARVAVADFWATRYALRPSIPRELRPRR